MGIQLTERRHTSGFTVVEILIAIVVIGILLGMVTVLYPNYQMRTRDAERKSDMSQLASAMSAYVLQKNNYMLGSGCGFLGDGSGWISLGPSDGGGFYPKAVLTCLKEAGLVNNESDFVDPFGCKSDTGGVCGQYGGVPAQAYMKATCTKNSVPITYFLAHLETEPRKDAEVDALCDTGSLPWFSATSQKWGTNYGMNYYVTVK